MSMREQVQEWFQAHSGYVPSGVSSLSGVNIEKVKGRWGEQLKATNALVSSYWTIGGQSGGSCWDEGEHRYHGISGEQEAEFSELDDFIEEVCPQLTYLQFKKLRAHIKYHEFTSDHDYYGNYTVSMLKYITMSDILDVLDEFDEN